MALQWAEQHGNDSAAGKGPQHRSGRTREGSGREVPCTLLALLQVANASQELAAAARYPYVRIFAAAPARSNVELEDLEQIDLPWSIPTAGECNVPPKESLEMAFPPLLSFAACCFLSRKPGPWEFHLLLGRVLAVGALPV